MVTKLPERARDRRTAIGLLLVVAVAMFLIGSISRSSSSSRPATAGTPLASVHTPVVPSLVGERYARAAARLSRQGTRAVELEQFSSEPAGVVLSQDTAAGTRLPIAATIALTVSKGVARSAMPELVGSSAQAATVKLRALQLAVLRFTVVSDVPVGTVVSSFPAPGSVLRYGDQARLNISGGIPVGVNLAAQAVVPDLHGASNTEAQARLRERGVTPNVLYVRSHGAAGLVVRQSVAPGTRARLGTIVGLDISLGSRGTAETPVPYIVGRARNAAVQLLRSTGFRVRLVSQRATARTPARTVLDEQPMGGTKAPVHAVVTIVIAA